MYARESEDATCAPFRDRLPVASIRIREALDELAGHARQCLAKVEKYGPLTIVQLVGFPISRLGAGEIPGPFALLTALRGPVPSFAAPACKSV